MPLDAFNRSREQKLIDIMFEVAQTSALYWANTFNEPNEYYSGGKRERHMEWLADQLRKSGFDTEPMGMSWGVLKEKK